MVSIRRLRLKQEAEAATRKEEEMMHNPMESRQTGLLRLCPSEACIRLTRMVREKEEDRRKEANPHSKSNICPLRKIRKRKQEKGEFNKDRLRLIQAQKKEKRNEKSLVLYNPDGIQEGLICEQQIVSCVSDTCQLPRTAVEEQLAVVKKQINTKNKEIKELKKLEVVFQKVLSSPKGGYGKKNV